MCGNGPPQSIVCILDLGRNFQSIQTSGQSIKKFLEVVHLPRQGCKSETVIETISDRTNEYSSQVLDAQQTPSFFVSFHAVIR